MQKRNLRISIRSAHSFTVMYTWLHQSMPMKHTGQALVFIGLCLGSCSPLYVPTARTMNHFSSKGQVNATVLADWPGFEGRAALSVTNHVFVHAGYSKSYFAVLNERDTTQILGMQGSFNHRMLDIGAGYYGKILGHYAEFAAGYSHGKSDAFEDVPSDPDNTPRSGPSRVINAIYNRFYGNAGITLIQYSNLRLSFNARVSVLKFSKMYSQTSHLVVGTDNLFVYFEPAVDMRHYLAGKTVYLLYNVGICSRLDNGPGQGSILSGDDPRPEMWGWSNSIGVGLHLGQPRPARTQ